MTLSSEGDLWCQVTYYKSIVSYTPVSSEVWKTIDVRAWASCSSRAQNCVHDLIQELYVARICVFPLPAPLALAEKVDGLVAVGIILC